MRWKLSAILAVGVLLGVAGADNEAVFQEIKSLEDKLNQAFKANDEAAIKTLITDDHVAATPYYDKPLAFAEQIKALHDTTLTEYSAGAMSFKRLADDVVQVTYHATLQGTYRGKPIPSKVFVSALWLRRGGRWQESFYQETPLPER